MVDSGSLKGARGTERATAGTGIQARLRSAFLSRGWTRQPEPRVRFGQPVLPGLAVLGPEHRDAAAALVAQAAAVRAGRQVRLGTAVAMGPQREWHPRGTSVAWRQALHGLDDLVALGVAAAVASGPDERDGWYACAHDLLHDWLRRGRAASGVAATPAAQAARIVHLVQAYGLFAVELRDDAPSRRGLLEALYADAVATAVWLPRQPADPWLVAGAHALVVAGRFFDGLEARGWVEQGIDVLWAQLREQVHDDGGHVSRDPAWHAFVLGEYLELVAGLRAERDEVPAWSLKRVRAMADCLARLTHPDGGLALPGGVPVAGQRPARELLAVAAVLLLEPAFAADGPLPGIWPLLVLGDHGLRAWAALPRAPLAPSARLLRRTSYALLPGRDGDVLIADGAAPFAYELSLGGERLVVGPGEGADEGHPLAPYARAPRARNVLVADDGQPPAHGGEPELRWSMRDGLICCTGTAALDADRRHRRCIAGLPGRFWIVCDELVGTGPWSGASLIHLHPDSRVLAACVGRPAFVASRGAGRRLTIVFAGTEPVELNTGTIEPSAQGWHAVAPGEFRPAPTVALPVRGQLPLVAGYALLPDGDADATLSFERDAFHVRAILKLRGVEYEVTILADEAELATHA